MYNLEQRAAHSSCTRPLYQHQRLAAHAVR
jgi:hypothetical protein